MIVFSQHVLAHSYEPTEIGDRDNTSTKQATDAVNTVKSFDVTTDKSFTEGDDTCLKQWQDARREVSAMLGSIGAQPIASPPPIYLASWSSGSNDTKETIVSPYLSATSQLAASHVHLIQTMTGALDVLKMGTSLRLGLGPTMSHFGNERLVSRAEKAWSGRGIRSGDHRRYPTLPMLRSRRMLHQAMVDQATSLRSVMALFLGDGSTQLSDWEEFMDDMQYLSKLLPKQTAPVLTLSKLSFWMNGLRGLLSFVMSHLLAGMDNFFNIDWNTLVSFLKRSSQFAEERVHFLASSFDLSQSSREESVAPQAADGHPNDMENRRNSLKLIQQLQSTLEAAQVSLWAFRQSFTEEGETPDCNHQGSEIWWSQLKDLLSQTETSMGRFEHSFLATANDGNKEETADSAGEPSCAIHATNDDRGTEHFVDVLDTQHEKFSSKADDSLPMEEHAEKTLIFSGSGLFKKSKQLFGNRDVERKSALLSTSCESFDRTMLMFDLRKRLKSMQLAEEHEVVSLDSCKEDGFHVTRKHQQAAPFFLGVQGSLLAELTNELSCSISKVNL